VFIIGAAAAWLVLRNQGSSAASPADAQVLYAAKPIAAGTTGDVAVANGAVKVKRVDLKSKPANALVDPSQLTGRTAQSNIPAGSTLLDDQFQIAQTVSGTVTIPAGKEALAVQLQNVPGVASYAGAGDKIDVFAVVKAQGAQPQTAKRVMEGVEVLKVNGTTLVPNQGLPGGPGLVFLLAVSPDQAEHLVYLTSFEQLYFALVPKDKAPVAPTAGATPQNVLAPVGV
jgi:Flp pilus assembly protein CpaB